MAFIDIAILFDTAKILKTPGGTIDKPTGLSHDGNTISDQWAFMVVDALYLDPNHTDTQATANLAVVAHPTDTIRWRAASLSEDAINAAIVWQILPNNASGTNILDTPKTIVQTVSVAVPNVGDASSFHPEPQTKPNVTANVNSTGTYPYYVYFYIVPRDTSTDLFGTPQYYYWDPIITVNQAQF